jgi:hypothetical protein
MCRCDDKVGRDEGASASLCVSIAARVDLTDCRPRFAYLLNYSSIVVANDARLQIRCGGVNESEGASQTKETDSEEAREGWR